MCGKFWNQKGLTVAELIVTIGIIAVLGAITAPPFSQWVLTYKVNLATQQLGTELMLARTKAVSQNINYIVTFYSPVGGPYKYEIHEDSNNNGARDAGEEVKSVTLPPAIQFGANTVNGVDNLAINSNGLNFGVDNTVNFNDRGYASETGAAYLIPSSDLSPSRNERMRAVSILQATGSVKGWNYRAGLANPGPWE